MDERHRRADRADDSNPDHAAFRARAEAGFLLPAGSTDDMALFEDDERVAEVLAERHAPRLIDTLRRTGVLVLALPTREAAATAFGPLDEARVAGIAFAYMHALRGHIEAAVPNVRRTRVNNPREEPAAKAHIVFELPDQP